MLIHDADAGLHFTSAFSAVHSTKHVGVKAAHRDHDISDGDCTDFSPQAYEVITNRYHSVFDCKFNIHILYHIT